MLPGLACPSHALCFWAASKHLSATCAASDNVERAWRGHPQPTEAHCDFRCEFDVLTHLLPCMLCGPACDAHSRTQGMSPDILIQL